MRKRLSQFQNIPSDIDVGKLIYEVWAEKERAALGRYFK
jgi:hypothetical protein